MQNTFANTLTTLRNRMNLTVQDLANKAKVNPTLVSGLQNSRRQIGEYNAKKLGHTIYIITLLEHSGRKR